MNKVEEFIKDYTNHCSNEMVFEDGSGSHLYEPWLTPEQALRAVEIEREELIDKAFKYINYQLNLPSDFEQHFRKAMKK